MGRARSLAAVVLAAAILGVPGGASATAGVTIDRLAGANRYGTAAAIADATFGDVTVALLATGEAFPDALAAAYVAGANPGPVVLTPRAGVSQETLDALRAVAAEGVIIVGGNEAVDPNVQTQLQAAGYAVNRIAGTDRYETAANLARALPAASIGQLGTQGRTAILASGEKFPDALAAGPISYFAGFPILLTQHATLPAPTANALRDLGIDHVVVLGGEVAVSSAVTAQLAAAGLSFERVGGANRMETAAQLADWAMTRLAWGAVHANLARGDEFADALSGGPNGGEERAPLLLTGNANDLSAPTAAWLNQHQATLQSIHVFGGTQAVSAATAEAARQAAGGI